jgi:hypothetical protein
MKRILSILLASSFLACSAYAGGMIGVKVGTGTVDGTKTVDPSHGIGSNTTGSKDSEYAAIFLEANVSDRVSLGIEIVPLEGIVDSNAAARSDTQVTVRDLKTVYALVPFGDTPIYGKVGYGHADLSVVANYVTTTVGSASDSLEGPMVGIGAQFDSPIPFLDVIRVEGTYYKFDELSITTTNTTGTADTHTKKGDAELMTISLSLAKSF